VTAATAPPSMPNIAARQTSFRVGSRASCTLMKVEIVLKRVEVAAGLIDLAQRERALV